MLGVKHTDHATNEEIYTRVGQKSLSSDITMRQLTWVGHMLRRDLTEPIRKYALYHPEEQLGTTKRGRPFLSFINHVADKINNQLRLNASEIEKAAQKRLEWKKLVLACSNAIT